MPRARPVLASAALLAVAIPVAQPRRGADMKHGITPLSPAAGDEVPRGKAPTFRLRSRGRGQVWVRVCASARTDRDGVICDRLAVGRAHRRRGGVYAFTPRLHNFPGFWLDAPGTYHWQAYRIACVRSDCRAEGPIVRFRVV